ncbi:CDK5 regulatory subunit-associated protein 2 [Microtus ochrogaster]|uniref:CDK5 regulatory subunit-associated protein 2 n=1 Tax=Microtus ochrogaster TaxID=79684 RepID=A0A8J6GHR7_MICOH|nr:CDK5 regulatory subunit-associated protein 2 [Microtus ochrogaster]
MGDSGKSDCKNEYLRHMDSNILDHEGANTPGILGDQSLEDKLLVLFATLFQKKATLLLGARPDLLKALGALVLERIYSGEQELPGDHLDSKAKKALQQVADQLRDELDLSFQDDSFSKSHNELKSTWGTWLVKTGDRAKVELKNAPVQTTTIEDTPMNSNLRAREKLGKRNQKRPLSALTLSQRPSCKENTGDFLGPTSVATYLNSKSQLSIKDYVIGTDQSENINIPNDTEALKQKTHALQTELDSYQNFIVQLQKPLKMIDSGMPESLTQQLEEQKELQKEQDFNLKLFSEIQDLENKF